MVNLNNLAIQSTQAQVADVVSLLDEMEHQLLEAGGFDDDLPCDDGPCFCEAHRTESFEHLRWWAQGDCQTCHEFGDGDEYGACPDPEGVIDWLHAAS